MLDRVRDAARAVAESARLVHVEKGAIAAYAGSLPLAQAHAPELDPATHYRGDATTTMTYVLMLDAINFGSGFFPHLKKRPGMSGYFTVASSLKDVFEAQGAPRLPGITAAECGAMFGQDPSNADVAELMGLFATALNDLGTYVEQRFGGSYVALVESAEGSAERLAEVLTGMPFYRDVSMYGGQEVPFYKRAQLTAADLNITGVATFDDLERLTIFADNLVPHVLRVDRILRYDPALAARIDSEELFEAGSPEEVEIRACALHAVELMSDALSRKISPMGLDYVLWNRGQQPAYKAIPRHRARSVFY